MQTTLSGAIVLCFCEVPRPGDPSRSYRSPGGDADTDRFETVETRNIAIGGRPVDRNPPWDNPRLVGAALRGVC